MKSLPPVSIIGIGNLFRSDDGIGRFIIRQIRKMKLPNVTLIEESGEGTLLMDRWDGEENVIVIDAVASGGKPGTIRRFNIRTDRLRSDPFHRSSHSFGLAEAIELSQTLGQMPENFIVYGIECRTFGDGVGISKELKQSVHEVLRRVRQDVRNFQKQMTSIETVSADIS